MRTDMAHHVSLMRCVTEALATAAAHSQDLLDSPQGTELLLSVALKCADISNQARPHSKKKDQRPPRPSLPRVYRRLCAFSKVSLCGSEHTQSFVSLLGLARARENSESPSHVRGRGVRPCAICVFYEFAISPAGGRSRPSGTRPCTTSSGTRARLHRAGIVKTKTRSLSFARANEESHSEEQQIGEEARYLGLLRAQATSIEKGGGKSTRTAAAPSPRLFFPSSSAARGVRFRKQTFLSLSLSLSLESPAAFVGCTCVRCPPRTSRTRRERASNGID